MAGTSFNCRGLNEDGREGRIIGDGLIWGEGATSVELATYAIQAVAAQWSQRGEPTALTDALIKFYDYRSVAELIENLVIFRHRIEPEFTQVVVEVARAGDTVAGRCVDRAAQALASLATGVIRQLAIEKSTFEIVVAGSMFKAGEILISPFYTYIQSVAPRTTLILLQAPPVVGAIVLAMRQSGHATQSIHKNLWDDLSTVLPSVSTLPE